jgi:PAS domain S-box-containing protein
MRVIDVANGQIAVCLALTKAISRTRTVEEIYSAALEALTDGLGVSRSAILLFDPDGVMRFTAHRGLSSAYRRAVEGHTPWSPDTLDPQPLVVPDVRREPSLAPFMPAIEDEHIGAMAFIPLVSLGRVIGKFMLYFQEPHEVTADEQQLAMVIAAQVAFAIERTRAEAQARRSEERLRFALDAASMGTWEWNLVTNAVTWSPTLEKVHELPAGTFDGTFRKYQEEIHPDDRDRVLRAIRRAIDDGSPYEVEYRIVTPTRDVRWLEGKGQVEYEAGRPARLSGVCRDVTPRKQAEISRLAAADEASRLKDEFLATLSHELRTPLNAILGWVQILQSSDLSPERVRHAIEVIARNGRQQAQLIEDILDISRIISGKLDIDRSVVRVPALVDSAVAAALPAARDKQIEIGQCLADDLPPIEGDAKRLQQVLGNVMSNAIKFTPEGGRIEIRCASRGDVVSIEVKDTGIGIDRDFLPLVFDRFRQADSRATRQHGGLGLGLAIARHLVERHSGHITAHSDGPNLGTTLTILLPAIAQWQDNDARLQPPVAPVHKPMIELRLDGTTVLVVDDEKDSRELLEAVFERCGADVMRSGSAEEALALLAKAPVSLMVADIAMPEVDGCELLERARRLHGGMPAIAVSAYARPEDRQRALAAGYNAYCAKPVETSEFLRIVRAVLSTS